MKILRLLFAACTTVAHQYIVMFKQPSQGKQNSAIYASYLRLQQSHFRKEDKMIKSFGYGYIAILSRETVGELEKEPYVKVLEPDQKMFVQHFKSDYVDLSHFESDEESDEKTINKSETNTETKKIGKKLKQMEEGTRKEDYKVFTKTPVHKKKLTMGNKKIKNKNFHHFHRKHNLLNRNKKPLDINKEENFDRNIGEVENTGSLKNTKEIKNNGAKHEKEFVDFYGFDLGQVKQENELKSYKKENQDLKINLNEDALNMARREENKAKFNKENYDSKVQRKNCLGENKKQININVKPNINYDLKNQNGKYGEDSNNDSFDEISLPKNEISNLYRDALSLKNKKLHDFLRIQNNFINGIISNQNSATWGLKKISKGFETDKNGYAFPKDAGANAVVFVLDTGIDIKHREFKGRAVWGVNLVSDSPDADENGHGTHCAGVIAGERVGVAKKTRVVAVKVLDKHGEGLVSRLVLGIDYVIRVFAEETEKDERKKRKKHLRSNPGFKKWAPFFSDGMKILDDLQLPLNFYDQEESENKDDENLGKSISSFEEDIINIIGGDAFKKPENDFEGLNSGKKGIKSRRMKYSGKKKTTRFIEDLNNYMETETKKPKFVVNMSVGGVKSKALDFAVEYASQLGIHFVAAAGNDNDDACDFSPSSSRVVITTGASTKTDKIAFFSNYGACVDIFAPGVDVLSSWVGNAYRLAEGTSMASPHVAGVAALYVSAYDFTPSELKNRIINDAAYVIEEQEHDHKIYSVSDFFNNRDVFDQKIGYSLPLLNTSSLMKRIVEDKKKVEEKV